MKKPKISLYLIISLAATLSLASCEADAIVVTFDVQDQAILDILTGAAEPSGLLPMQMPVDMKIVENQKEDVPYDMTCHLDSEGNSYDFGFGLNWKGVIKGVRVEKYRKIS